MEKTTNYQGDVQISDNTSKKSHTTALQLLLHGPIAVFGDTMRLYVPGQNIAGNRHATRRAVLQFLSDSFPFPTLPDLALPDLYPPCATTFLQNRKLYPILRSDLIAQKRPSGDASERFPNSIRHHDSEYQWFPYKGSW